MGETTTLAVKICIVAIIVAILARPVAVNAQGQAQENQMNSLAQPDAKSEVRVFSASEYRQMVDDVRTLVRADIENSLFSRQQQYWAFAAAAVAAGFAILGFIGVRRIDDVKQSIEDKLIAELRKETDSAEFLEIVTQRLTPKVAMSFQKVIDQLRLELQLAQLIRIAKEVHDAESFSPAQRDMMINSVISLKDAVEITNKPEYGEALELVIGSLFKSGSADKIDQLLDCVQAIAFTSRSVLFTLMQHYGHGVIGGFDRAVTTDKTTARFFEVVKALKADNCYEIALPYLLVYENANDVDTSAGRIREYLHECKFLQPDEKASAASTLESMSDVSKLAMRPTASIVRIAEKTNAFLSRYHAELSAVGIKVDIGTGSKVSSSPH